MNSFLLVLFSAIVAGSTQAQIVIGPGQSQTITCSSNGGGGGGNNLACVKDVSDYCYSHTSQNQTVCYEQASRYCPSLTFSTCVKDTTDYCYSHTSMNQTDCFKSALGSCRGNSKDVINLLNQVMQAGRLMEKGVDPASLKIQEPMKLK